MEVQEWLGADNQLVLIFGKTSTAMTVKLLMPGWTG